MIALFKICQPDKLLEHGDFFRIDPIAPNFSINGKRFLEIINRFIGSRGFQSFFSGFDQTCICVFQAIGHAVMIGKHSVALVKSMGENAFDGSRNREMELFSFL